MATSLARSALLLSLVSLLVLAAEGARIRRTSRKEASVGLDVGADVGAETSLGKRHRAPAFNNGTDEGDLTFKYFEALDIYYFATAAYCTADNIDKWDSGRKAIVHPDVKDVLAYNTTVPLLWNIEHAPVLFFILYYPSNDSIVLSFQGTQGDSVGDWVDDFMYAMTKPPLEWGWPSGEEVDVDIRIEDGFTYAWNELRDVAYNQTVHMMRKYPSAKFYVTGHSLSGALASLAAADLAMNGIDIYKVIIFGAPRAGNLGWAFFYNDLLGLKNSTFRVVNERDPVPHIPFTGVTFMRGYHHVGIEVWLNGFDFVQCNNVLPFEECKFSTTCFYNEDQSCSLSQTICLTPSCIEMHVGYYETVSDDKFCVQGC